MRSRCSYGAAQAALGRITGAAGCLQPIDLTRFSSEHLMEQCSRQRLHMSLVLQYEVGVLNKTAALQDYASILSRTLYSAERTLS